MRYLILSVFFQFCLCGCKDPVHTFIGPAPEAGSIESSIVWPDLSEFAATSDRVAIADDVAADEAVFVAQSDGRPIGEPIGIELPQYANHIDVDTGKKTPCVVIQAEKVGDYQLVGVVV